MRSTLFKIAVMASCMAGCGGQSTIKPAEVLDERTGITVGALQEPVEFVINAQNAALSNTKRATFAYLGPIEWDRMGDISYALWIHVAPGNDRQVADIRSPGAVTVNLDDGPLVLSPIDPPGVGEGPYKPAVSWGQTSYFALTADMLKHLAGSRQLTLSFRAADGDGLEFIPSQDTHATLTQFTRARGLTDD